MIDRIFFEPRNRGSLRFAALFCSAIFLLFMAVRQAAAQAVPAATWPVGDTSPEDQPLAGQQLGTSLTLNQGVGAITAENEAFDRYGLALQAEGGGQTNFFGTQTGQVTAAYINLSADGGVIFRTNRSRFYALYQPQYNIYPQFSEVNNFHQSIFANADHIITEHLGVEWNLTAARYLSLNQFLPQTLGIGGIGIVVPILQSVLLQNSSENTNAATNISFRYLKSARTTFSGTLTGSYFLLVPHHSATGQVNAERYLAGGADLRMEYQWTLRDMVGARLTPIYIAGLTPAGHTSAETLQATYQRQFTAKTTIQGAAGPLFIQSTSHRYGSTDDISYAVNASISHQARQSQFSLGYTRAFVVSFLTPSMAAQQVGLNAYIPLPHRLLLTSAASFTYDTGVGNYGGKLYGGSAQISYLLGSKAQIYAIYSGTSQDLSSGLTQSYNFTQNRFGAGIRFNLGNPITRGGAQ